MEKRVWKGWRACVLGVSTGLALSAAAGAQPAFSKLFSPDIIGPGSVSTLSFDVTNGSPSPVTDLAFSDTLPAGVTIATPANPTNTCGGTLTAPEGGSTITFASGLVGGSDSCVVTVDVTSSTPGLHTNVSGDLTSSAGNSGTATDDLTVFATRPGFSKGFTPGTVGLGGRSTLTFTIDNSANASTALGPAFTDNLPTGLVVADPANPSTTCTGGVVTAAPGSSVISFSGVSVLATSTCTVSVDVSTTAAGALINVSDELTSFAGGSGKASAQLDVTTSALPLVKSFTDDPVNPGGTVTLELSLTNTDRNFSATNITFTDDLDATLSGLAATGLPAPNVCGAGSTLSGTSLLTLSGGSLAPEDSCTFSVTLLVPGGAAAGAYPNTTSSVSAAINGSPFVGAGGTETLFVNEAPVLTKTFLTDPVGPGGTATMEFTITNSSSTSSATAIAFSDNLSAFLSGTTVSMPPAPGFCGAGSMMSLSSPSGDLILDMSGGNLGPSGSCTFSVDLSIPVGAPPGIHLNTTGPISATVDGMTQSGAPASDTLTVPSAPTLSKSFTDDPTLPGGTVTLELSVSHDALATADALSIAFTDDLNATLSGLAATGLPLNDICGAGSQISGTTVLSFTGGSLAPGGSCTVSVTLTVPAGALPGSYPNTTSDVTATVGGVGVTGNPAADDLQVAGLSLTKTFTDDPVIPGGAVTLEFTVDNSSASDATGLFFTDDLNATLAGLAATGLPLNDICGPGSQIFGTTFLIFVGGNLTAGTSCTFSVTLTVPGGASSGTFLNITSSLSGTLGGSGVVVAPATDDLVVNSTLLSLGKSFTDDPVAPGGTVTLELTLTNLDPSQSASAIAFTDDLDATLSGLVATGLPAMNVCGAGSSASGAGVLTFSGGSLAGGASCTFSVTLSVPTGAGTGSFPNTTSGVTGTIAGLPVDGAPASDDLLVQNLAFTKAFSAPAGPSGTTTLNFTIDNLDASGGVAGLSFTDDLDGVVPGLVATGLPLSDVCGTGSLIAGSGLLTLTGGSLGAGASCTFGVTVQLPASAVPGTFVNTTSDLFVAGLSAAAPASAPLTVVVGPIFSKSFTPNPIGLNGTTTLLLTIDNSANVASATGLSFNDNLPAGMLVATPGNPATTCTGGTLSAADGSGVVSYSGGSVAAGATCTVSVDVTSSQFGVSANSVDLTSSFGGSGTASDVLNVTALVSEIPTLSPVGLVVLLSLVVLIALRRLGG